MPKIASSHQQLGRNKEGSSQEAVERGLWLGATCQFGTSSLQDCERINFCCFKPQVCYSSHRKLTQLIWTKKRNQYGIWKLSPHWGLLGIFPGKQQKGELRSLSCLLPTLSFWSPNTWASGICCVLALYSLDTQEDTLYRWLPKQNSVGYNI